MITVDRLHPLAVDEIWDILSAAQTQAVVPIGPIWTRVTVQSELSQGATWGLRVGGGLMAFVCLRQNFDIWEIVHLATHPKEQGRGYMRQLLQHIMGLLPMNGQIWLDVHSANGPAQALYRSLGFEMVGQRPAYYQDKGDAWLFSFRK